MKHIAPFEGALSFHALCGCAKPHRCSESAREATAWAGRMGMLRLAGWDLEAQWWRGSTFKVFSGVREGGTPLSLEAYVTSDLCFSFCVYVCVGCAHVAVQVRVHSPTHAHGA